jgi:hypothetical protein
MSLHAETVDWVSRVFIFGSWDHGVRITRNISSHYKRVGWSWSLFRLISLQQDYGVRSSGIISLQHILWHEKDLDYLSASKDCGVMISMIISLHKNCEVRISGIISLHHNFYLRLFRGIFPITKVSVHCKVYNVQRRYFCWKLEVVHKNLRNVILSVLFTTVCYFYFLKVHKIEIFFGFDFEICIISLLVMWKY